MNKEQFLTAIKADVKEVEVAALGVFVKFKALTGRARDAFHKTVSEGDKSASHFEAAIVAATVLDDTGNPMFSADDVSTLRDQNADAVSALAKAALKVNNIGAEAEAAAAKN